MSTIEKRITDTVLKRIRALARPNGDVDVAPDGRPEIAKPVSVREARFSDFDQVCALNMKLGQGPDSPENWNRLWLDNPALGDRETPSVIGWVLEGESSEIVGFLGSVRTLYEYEGKTLLAVIAVRFAVQLAYRPFSHLLVTSFFRQKNVDLFLNTTATVSTGKMMIAFKASRIPEEDYENVLFWVIDPYYFTKSVFRRMRIASGLSRVGSVLASLAVRADIRLRGRELRGRPFRYTVIETCVNNISDEFQRFWAEKSKETSRLLAKRSPAIMRWHFDPPGNRRVARVLGCYSGNHLVGYGIVRHDEAGRDGLRRSILADLMVEDDDPCIVEQLLAAIYESAKNAGSHILEVMGFPKGIRQMFLKWKPYSRRYPACPFFYKARDRALHEILADENVWYACPFDGDGTLWP
jgi:hypothetical protein